jgi:hypothetical protein
VDVRPLGDLAEQVAAKAAADFSAPVAEAQAVAEEAAITTTDLFAKIRFSWRPEDRAILDRIRIAADAAFEQANAEAIVVLDEFYAALRVPKQRDGVVLRDAQGRVLWETDERGRPIERWSQLTGQDIEHTLAKLQRLKFVLAPQVDELLHEAVFARHVASDVYDDTWTSQMDGTQGDRSARGNRESRVDRYHAFFRYVIYSRAKTFLDEIINFEKLLTNVRYWQTRTYKG